MPVRFPTQARQQDFNSAPTKGTDYQASADCGWV